MSLSFKTKYGEFEVYVFQLFPLLSFSIINSNQTTYHDSCTRNGQLMSATVSGSGCLACCDEKDYRAAFSSSEGGCCN